jgi:hypothetical protein
LATCCAKATEFGVLLYPAGEQLLPKKAFSARIRAPRNKEYLQLTIQSDYRLFVAGPHWKKLSNDPKFKLDPPTVSNITSLVLRPLAYSQV